MTNVYPGDELVLFAQAENWKSYLAALITPYLGQRVLEVGAGIGGFTRHLAGAANCSRWVCLEPDPGQAATIAQQIQQRELPACCEVVSGTLGDLPPGELFDSLLYLDVLEHIEDDAGEVAAACARLLSGGHLLVLSPAHAFLYSAFDRAVGHYRRYTTASLAALGTDGLTSVAGLYLDSLGIALSLANRLLLRQSTPTREQVLLWDRRVVPLSRRVDRLLGYRVGKSVLQVWRRD